MSKRYFNLFPSLSSWENLLLAWKQARKGKRSLPPAATFEQNVDRNLLELQAQLETQNYWPGQYVSFVIHEPKLRIISAAPFRDRVVHHALCNIIEPIFERHFIYDSYANRVDKGTHAAIERCQIFAQCHTYVLQCDIQQFFPAIDHQILYELLAKVIGDPATLSLCQLILQSGAGILDDAYDMHYFPCDDLFAVNRPRGLPIGNLTSQFWANVYLNKLDQFVKRHLKCTAYLRFADDFLLFADDKALLWQWRRELIAFLATLRLTIHENRCHPQPVSEGIPFLGFTIFPNYRRLKRRKGVEYVRRLKELLERYEMGEVTVQEISASVQGWVAHASTGQTYGLRREILSSFKIHPLHNHE